MQSDVTHLTLQDQVLTWFEKNKRQLLFGTVALAVIGTVVGIYLWRQNQTQVEASEALSKAASSAMVAGAPGASTEALLKVAADYAGTDAAKRAVLLAAGNYFTDGNYPLAQAQFEKFLRDYRESAFVGQALLGVAACKDAQGKTDEAITAYKDIVDHHSTESVAPQARFALGRLYEKQNKPELARDLYLQVAQMDQNGALGAEAGMRMAELNAKYPSLVTAKPATVSPSGMPVPKPVAKP